MDRLENRMEAIDRMYPGAAGTMMRLLTDPYAHALLSCVRGDQDSLEHLADRITAWRAVELGRIADQAERRRTLVLLHHRYAPQLADHDLVAIDRPNGTIRGTAPEPILELLDVLPSDSWEDD